ncbi:hypothetical protein [Yoonia sp. BS5-3]|uniref:DUF1761 family protein n=1 Tax=Yoonia phaeophyticola TaxID=3137369 RepID=A0ABZ2V6E5_9RHOB
MALQTVLTVLAFMVVSFAVQGLSHFIINAKHFADIGFMRPDPILPMGFAVMIIQALIISFVMINLWPNGATIMQALTVAACFGLFLGSYIALAEPAKYAAPSIPAWIMVEASASFVQFAGFGVLLGLIYRGSPAT